VVAWTANTVIGLQLKGTDAGSNGCCHNIIRLKLLYNHRYNTSFAIDGSGWTNANTVIGGLLSNSSTVDEAAAGVGSVTCYRIHSLGGGDNRLFGVRLETLVGDDSDIMAIYVATGNLMMYGSSFEWDAYDGTYAPIYFHTDAVGVKILAAQFATDGGSYRISDFVQDLGSTNEVHGRDERYELGGWYRAAPTVSNATADPVVLWAMAVPDDCVIQVNAIVSGRKSDNSEYVQLRMTAIGKAASGTATLGDSDVTELNNVGAVVVDDCVFDASGDTIRLKVGGNDVGETDTYYFAAMVEWQIVST